MAIHGSNLRYCECAERLEANLSADERQLRMALEQVNWHWKSQ